MFLSGLSCLFERKKSENARFFYNKDQGSPLREIIVFSTTAAAAVFLTMGSKTSCLFKQKGNYLLSCIYGFKDYSQTNGKIYVCSKKPKMLPQRVIELYLQLFSAPSLGRYFEYLLA